MTATTFNLNEILAKLMFERQIKTTELARQTNIPQPTLSRIMSGETVNPHLSSLEPLADFFNITVAQLKGLEPIPALGPVSPESEGWSKIPLLDWQQVTTWTGDKTQVLENRHLYTDAKIGARGYALNMNDASMEPQFPKGTVIIIDPEKPVKDRSFIVVKINHHPTVIFRQLLIDGPHQYLKPLSPDFDQFKMTLLSDDDQILGVLLQARRSYEE